MQAEPMTTRVPLHRYPAITTRDPDELRRLLGPTHAISAVHWPSAERRLDCQVNRLRLSSSALSYADYGGKVGLSATQGEYFIQGFPLEGCGRATWNKNDMQISPTRMGVIGNPGSSGLLEYAEGFRHLVLQVDPRALLRKAAALTGHVLNGPLRFLIDAGYDPLYGLAQLRLIGFLIRELDNDTLLPQLVLDEMEQAIIVSMLYASENTYSSHLQSEPRPAAPWQARRVAEYIEAHWNSSISIEELAHVSNVSTRSLFQIFRRTYGVSPMSFVKKVRLERARDMLRAGGPGVSVTSVCYMCGYSNLGRFSRDYTAAFDERPSQSLRKS